MKTNAAGLDLIKRNEGCELTTYVCPAGKLTIGYGDTGPHVVHGMRITQEEAEELLANRLEREFEAGVLKLIGDAPTTYNQFSALVSLAYNIGLGGLRRSTVLRMHCDGRYDEAAEAFGMWNQGGGRVLPGLVRRRQEEADLYLTPDEEDG
jgi:lysozyme